MNIRAIATTALAGLTLAAFAGVAAAAPKSLDTGKTSLGTEGGAGTTAFFFGSGFEPGEGFAVGNAEPQNGWTATGTNLPWERISNLAPFTGTQHVRLTKDVTAGVGTTHVLLSPITATPANTARTVYVKVKISNYGGADHDVFGQSPSQGFLSWRVKFSFSDDSGSGPGTIYVLDDVGLGLDFQNTGVTWTPGVYKELRVDFDPVFGYIYYYYAGVLIYTGGLVSGTNVEQAGFFTDNFQLAGETGDFDALSIQGYGDPAVGVAPRSWSQMKGLWR